MKTNDELFGKKKKEKIIIGRNFVKKKTTIRSGNVTKKKYIYLM